MGRPGLRWPCSMATAQETTAAYHSEKSRHDIQSPHHRPHHPLLQRLLAQLLLRQGHHRGRRGRLERVRRRLRLARASARSIAQLAARVVGQSAMQHERIREDLHCVTRPGSGGVVGQALGAIENALLDAKAKTLGVPCYELLGGKVRDRMRVYWSHCVTWRAGRVPHYQPVITDADRRARPGARGARQGLHRAEDQHLALRGRQDPRAGRPASASRSRRS